MATIASLLVKLGVDAADVEKGMTKGQQLIERHGQGVTTAAAGIGLAAGAALAMGLSKALEKEQALDMLEAQIGPGSALAADLGKVAGDMYAKGFGESMADVSAALQGVWQNGLVDEDAATADIEAVASTAMNVSKLMGEEYGSVTKAIGQMIKTGMVKDAQQGFDLLVRGQQEGINKSQDMLDTFNEYGTQFRKLGLDGPAAMGLISQAIKGGARDADVAADALKEFSIRAVDGSTTSAEGFKAIGLNAEKMTKIFAKGGPEASAALGTVLEKLRGMKDPVAQSQAAVALFGTQAEDLGAALFKMDTKTATAGLGEIAGAADKAGAAMSDNAATKLEVFKRGLEKTFVDVAARDVIPALEKMGKWVKDNSGTLQTAAVVLGVFAAAVGVVKLGIMAFNGVMMLWRAAVLIATAVQWAWNIAMSMNPIGFWILVIMLVIGVIVLLWKKCDWFRKAVIAIWDFIVAAFKKWWSVFSGFWTAIGEFIGGLFKKWWDMFSGFWGGIFEFIVTAFKAWWGRFSAFWSGIGDFFSGLFTKWWNLFTGFWGSIIDFFKSIPGKVSSVTSGMFDGIKNAFKAAVNFVIRGWNSIKLSLPSVDMGPLGKFGGFTLQVPQLPLLAKGGDIRGAGDVIVGEAGPERLSLPRGARVSPLPAGGGGGPAVIEIHSGGTKLDDLLVELLREAIRKKGGSAEKVLSQRRNR